MAEKLADMKVFDVVVQMVELRVGLLERAKAE